MSHLIPYCVFLKQGYKNWLKKNGGKEALLPGLDKTNEQLLFISFAQVSKTESCKFKWVIGLNYTFKKVLRRI